MRAHTLLPQVTGPRTLAPGARKEGLLLILLGLFKKIVVADNMAPIANAMFWRLTAKDAPPLAGGEVLVGLYALAFQIYGDFSGYSSIARGISKWLGYELILNFRMPYLSTTPSEFWTRWHISLSTWLRDYLYIPLGGNRGGNFKTYRNLMLTMLLTMLLGGLWHGASWTFVAWGAYHGALLCAGRALGLREITARGNLSHKLVWAVRVLILFHLTCLGWLLFRAESFAGVTKALHIMATSPTLTLMAMTTLAVIFCYCALLFGLEWALDGEKRLPQLFQSAWPVRAGVYGYLLWMLISFPAAEAHEFIYFQF